MSTDSPIDNTHTFVLKAILPGDESPSLEPAVLRIEHAAKRLTEVRAALTAMEDLSRHHPLKVTVSKASVDAGVFETPTLRWDNNAVDHERQRRLRVLTGEVIYHLRTALEYIAYHLVWLDNGAPVDRTKFPMVPVGKEADWLVAAARGLPGVTPANLERVRVLQPFAGCAWTADLTAMSNADKHRHPIKVNASAGAEFSMKTMVVRPDPDHPDRYVLDTNPTIEVLTHDGRPLYDTLLKLVHAVNGALVDFSEVLPGPKPKR